jgi:hypothetical protein
MSFYLQLSRFLEEKAYFIKSLLIAAMAFVALFIDKERPWFHWTWASYSTFTILLLLLEYRDNQEKQISPSDKIKKCLANFNAWKSSGADNFEDYYDAAPEFTIRTNDKDNHLDFKQEWTRGEIGAHYATGNGAYYREIYFHGTLLHQIHVVIFDGGKKTIVAPRWEAVGYGRMYYYLQDSIEYAYQQFLVKQRGKDHSKIICRPGATGTFDIPVFTNDEELQRFIVFCGEPQNGAPERNKKLQNKLLNGFVDKLREFRDNEIKK